MKWTRDFYSCFRAVSAIFSFSFFFGGKLNSIENVCQANANVCKCISWRLYKCFRAMGMSRYVCICVTESQIVEKKKSNTHTHTDARINWLIHKHIYMKRTAAQHHPLDERTTIDFSIENWIEVCTRNVISIIAVIRLADWHCIALSLCVYILYLLCIYRFQCVSLCHTLCFHAFPRLPCIHCLRCKKMGQKGVHMGTGNFCRIFHTLTQHHSI